MGSVLSKIRLEEPTGSEPLLLELGESETRHVLEALSGGTTTRVFEALHDRPATPSELADRLDTSLQNVHYHLEKLGASDLVDTAGTQYSEKGREMTIYAPANDPIIIVGDRSSVDGGIDVLSRWAGALAVVAAASVLVQFAASVLAADPSPSVGPAFTSAVSRGARGPELWGLPPGALVFVGGLLVVGLAAYYRWSR